MTTVDVLAVTQDEAQATDIEVLLRRRLGSTLTFERVASGAEALERLAHTPADIVICAHDTADLPGLTVLQRVRRDQDTAVILLDRSALSQFVPSRFDVVLDTTASPADVLDAAYGLLAASGHLDDAARPFHGAFPDKRPHQDIRVSGTLETMTLFDLVLSLTQKRSSGRLYLLLGHVEALLALQQGRLVHAEYRELTGEDAVMKTFLEAELHPNAEFLFEPGSVRLPPDGVTLHTSAQEILLRVAVGLDQYRTAGG